MRRKLKNRTIACIHDVLAIPVAWLGAYWLRFNLDTIPPDFLNYLFHNLPLVMLIQIGSFVFFSLYRGIWRFASLPDLIRIIKAVIVGSLFIVTALFFYAGTDYLPRSILPLYSILLVTLLAGSRLLFRWIRNRPQSFPEVQRVLTVGAGQAGESLVRDMLRNPHQRYIPIVFADDDKNKLKREVHQVRVAGRIKEIPELVKRFNIDLIIIAIPSLSALQMRKILSYCEQAGVPIRTLPGFKDLASGRISVNAVRDVLIEDLLGREPIDLNKESIGEGLQNKTIVVTGGGGSIGSELCRQIAQFNPLRLIVLEKNEFNLYSLELELKRKFPDLCFLGLLVDIIDKIAVEKVFNEFKPEMVFHAAAYKHVPMLETQVRIAVLNNIIGTRTVAEIAIQHQVNKFVLISTDKAVNPSNIMGATKRAAEIFCQNCDNYSSTQFITVRFGNVLDSAGSVVPLFRQQIAQGGPVTITHPEVTRFFMTIPEASQLILQATMMGEGGEIFVLNMGQPIKITHLAEQMIRLMGLKPGEDIELKFVGLRPGEKMFEMLFYENEPLLHTQHNKILRARSLPFIQDELLILLDEMIGACQVANEIQLRQLLLKLVPEYQSVQHDDKEVIEGYNASNLV